MPEYLSACLQRDTCAVALAATGQLVVTAVLVVITVYYAVQTHGLVLEQQRDRAATFLPLFFWQSPLAACGVSATDWSLIRRRLNVVLWNIGSGAARVTYKEARNSERTPYHLVHFDVPSIVPAKEQLTLRAFRDQTVEEIIRANDSNFLRQEDVTVILHYDDVVEHHHYETHIIVRCRFDEAQGGKMQVIDTPAEPSVEMTGFPVPTRWVFADSRSAGQRLVRGKCVVCASALR